MRYFSVRPKVDFWHDYVCFRAKWRDKYNLTMLAKELGFSISYISEVLSGKNKGEISSRLIGTSVVLMGSSFDELWEVVPVNREPNDPIPEKVNGQTFSVTETEKDDYLVAQEKRYNYLIASADYATRIGYRKKIKNIVDTR